MCEPVLIDAITERPGNEEEITLIVQKPETDPSGFNAQYGYE